MKASVENHKISENGNIIFSEKDIYMLSIPEYSEWQMTLTAGTILRPLKGQEPNWFWRKMQYLAFGFKWEKVTSTKGDSK